MKNLIIGKRSILSQNLKNYLVNCEILSANNINLKKLNNRNSNIKINIIFNNFYPSHLLNTISAKNYKKFLDLSIGSTVRVLTNLNLKNINKIIYTSSASVYNLNLRSDVKKDKMNRYLYSSFKIAAENLIRNFTLRNNIQFYCLRVFNIYGDSRDKFSIIEKLKKNKKNKKKIILINNGNSVRDYIHIKDVCLIYKKFLNEKIKSGNYDIGTGKGKTVSKIVKILNIRKNKIKKVFKINELKFSVARNNKFFKIFNSHNFIKLEDYLRSKK